MKKNDQEQKLQPETKTPTTCMEANTASDYKFSSPAISARDNCKFNTSHHPQRCLVQTDQH